MKKTIRLLLSVLLLLCSLNGFAFAEPTESTVTAHGITEISKYGNVKINISHAEISRYFELGDIVTVSFGEASVDVPICIAFSDVDSGSTGLFCQLSDGVEEVELAVNMGNFAEKYGIAVKTSFPDKSYVWNYCEGFSKDTCFSICMKEKAGYLTEFTIRNLIYTNERSHYPSLADEEFANFRPVTLGRIAKGVLYRSSSPLDPSKGRNTYAEEACRKVGITNFINLDDTEQSLTAFEGYEESYYALTKEDEAYSVIVNGNIRKTLENAFGTDPAEADLVKEAKEYLTSAGLSEKEILSLRSVLSHRCVLLVLLGDFFAKIMSFFGRFTFLGK